MRTCTSILRCTDRRWTDLRTNFLPVVGLMAIVTGSRTTPRNRDTRMPTRRPRLLICGQSERLFRRLWTMWLQPYQLGQFLYNKLSASYDRSSVSSVSSRTRFDLATMPGVASCSQHQVNSSKKTWQQASEEEACHHASSSAYQDKAHISNSLQLELQ